MTLAQIPAKDNLVNLKNDPKLYYILIGGALLSTISFVLTKNLLSVFTFALISFTIFLILNTPPKDIVVTLTDTELNVGEYDVKLFTIDSWVATNHGDWLEIMVKSTNAIKPFYIFYLPAKHPNLQQFLTLLSERAAYDQTIADQNVMHNWMRRFGLR
ncbi:MAG: hypothetical protein OHK0017_12890 [Patescibacteria group bacterium]